MNSPNILWRWESTRQPPWSEPVPAQGLKVVRERENVPSPQQTRKMRSWHVHTLTAEVSARALVSRTSRYVHVRVCFLSACARGLICLGCASAPNGLFFVSSSFLFFSLQQQKEKVEKLVKKQLRSRGHLAIRGEADRVILNDRPKHLFTGKRGSGKTERR